MGSRVVPRHLQNRDPLRLLPIAAALALTAAVNGCGGEGEPAPVAVVETGTCPTLDESLAGTLQALDNGELDALTDVLADLGMSFGTADVLVAILNVLSAIAPDYVDPVVLSELATVAEAVEPLLMVGLAPLSDAATANDQDTLLVFDATADVLEQCPTDTMADALLLLFDDPTVIDALVTALADERTAPIIENAFGELGSDQGRRGFVAFFDAVALAVRSDPFDYDRLLMLLGALLPVDEPPLLAVVEALRPRFTTEALDKLDITIACLEDIESTNSQGQTDHAYHQLVSLLYTLYSAAHDELGAALVALKPLLTGQIPQVQALLEAALTQAPRQDTLGSLFEALPDLLRYPRSASLIGALQSLASAGALSEIVEALAVFAPKACDRRTVPTTEVH